MVYIYTIQEKKKNLKPNNTLNLCRPGITYHFWVYLVFKYCIANGKILSKE